MDSNVKHEFLNVGTGSSISIMDLANVVIDASGLSLKPYHGPELPGDIKTTQADIGLIKKLLGWEPETRLEDWLNEVISAKNFKDV
jgi:UDP-glucose 4-epimerase